MGIQTFTTARDELLAASRQALTGEQMCALVARAVRRVAPYDAGALMSTDPETHLPAGGVVTGFDTSACEPFWDNELLDPDFNKFNDLAHRVEPIATLIDATDGDLNRSPRYHKLYAGLDATDELRVAFMSGATCLAIGAFVRCDGVFTPTETTDVRNLLVPAVEALRSALVTAQPAVPQTPVTILLDPDGNVVTMSEGAAAILDDLRVNIDGQVPGTILIAASRARRNDSTRVTTRLRGTSGRWMRLHVAPMDGAADLVAITIDRATASDLAPILLDSYGLTSRESEIVMALCRGLATKQVSTELGISTHTVRDHLKSIYAKTGVNARGELIARLFTSHVLTSFEERVNHVAPASTT